MNNIPEDKRDRLIEAMIDEYSKNGYQNASTNAIVKSAGISKGSLFNYVGNKKEQYLLIIEYLIEFLLAKMNEYSKSIELSDDYFDNILIKSKLKIRLSMEYPKEYKLLMDAYMEKDEEVKAFMQTQGMIFSKNKVFKERVTINKERLIDPGSGEKLSEMVYYLIAGYTETFLKRSAVSGGEPSDTLEKMTEELEGYFDILKSGLFKDGEV